MLFIVVCGSPVLSAKTLIVNNTPDVPTCPAEYATIQGGVDAAAVGDTVYVCAGTYNEQVVISQNMTLAGQTGATIMPSNAVPNTTELYGNPMPLPAAAIILVEDASNVTVSGFIVDGSNLGINDCGTDVLGIYYQNSGGIIADNAVRFIEQSLGYFGCQVGLGILAESTNGASNSLDIAQNSIHDYQKDGIDFDAPTYKLTAKYNVVQGVGLTGVIGQNGIEIDAASSSSILSYNTVSGNLYTCPADCPAATDILNFVNALSVTSNTTTAADVAIYYDADDATISSNSVSGISEYDGIILLDSVADAGSVISANSVTNAPYAIELYGSSSKVKITNNKVVESIVGISNDNSNAITVTGNKIYDTVTSVVTGAAPAAQVHRTFPAVSRAR